MIWKSNHTKNGYGVRRRTPLEKGVTTMKATGIVRRIDDLGRVVVPKEIRRTLRIREGDPLQTIGNNFEKSSNYAGLNGTKQNLFITGIVGLATKLGL